MPRCCGPLKWPARCEIWEDTENPPKGRDKSNFIERIGRLTEIHSVECRQSHGEGEIGFFGPVYNMWYTGCSSSSRDITRLPFMTDKARSYVVTEPFPPPTSSHRPPGTIQDPLIHFTPTSLRDIQHFLVNFTSWRFQLTSALLLNNTHCSNSSAEYDDGWSSRQVVGRCCTTYW